MQRDEQRRRTRGALLTAAAHEFEERGYQATSLADVAERLGLVRATVHFHFATKEKLAAEIIASQAEAWRVEREGALRAEGCDAVARLRTLALAVGERWLEDARVRAACRLLTEPQFSDAAAGANEEWRACVHRLLEDGRADGSLGAGVDPDADSGVLVAAAGGVLRSMSADDASRSTALLRRFTDLTEQALRS